MDNKNLENNIKRAFDQFDPQLDNDAIWENIEPHLKERKKRRFLLIWFLLGGLGILFLAKTLLVSPEIELLSSSSSIQDEEIEKVAIAPIQNENITLKEKETEMLIPINKPVKKSVKNTVRSSEKWTDNTPFHFSEPREAITDLKKATQQAYVTVHTFKQDQIPFLQQTIKPISSNQSNKLLTISMLKPKEEKASQERERIRRLKKNRWKFYVQTSVAAILPLKYLGQAHSTDQTYASRRKDTEKQLEAFGLNLNFQVAHKKGLLFSAGLNFQQLNERFDLLTITEETGLRMGVISITEDEFGQVVETTTGLKRITTEIIEELKIYNNYRFLNVPIGIGMKWKNNNARYMLMGGVDLNLVYDFNGTILSGSLEPVAISKRENSSYYESIFKSKANMGLWISGQYNRFINKRLQWVISPKIQIPFSSLTQKDHSIDQRYYNFSLDFGIRYLLNPTKRKKRYQ